MNIIKENSAKDVLASKMSIHRNGSLVIFCGSHNALLVNLNDNKSGISNSIGGQAKEITCCQWNKQSDNLAIGLSNMCDIYDCDLTKQETLNAHNAPISSIDWHPNMKHQIISSSYDNTKTVCIWDVRYSDVPTALKDMPAVQQVKWHKLNTQIFATSSDSDIRIWDQRNLALPIKFISAHSSHVSDFDWLLREDYSLISCGQFDQKLKLWNFSDDNRCLKFQVDESINISHCKLNPMGNSLLTLTVPEPGQDNQLIISDISADSEIKKRFSLPFITNPIVGVEWRVLASGKHQIVSLHQNFDYKVWDVDDSIVAVRNSTKDSAVSITSDSVAANGRFYLSPSPLSFGDISNNITTVCSETFTNSKTNQALENLAPRYSDSNLIITPRISKIMTEDVDTKINREFDRLTNNSQVVYEKIAPERKVIAHLNLVNARCAIMFVYRSVGASGVLLEATVVPERSDKLRKQNIDELEKILKNTMSKNFFGISKCVDAALDYIGKLSSRVSIRSVRAIKDNSGGPNFFCNIPDLKVPFPRTCGARFSPSGLLVCFLLPPSYVKKSHPMPRTFVDVAKHSNSTVPGKDFFYGIDVVTSSYIPQRFIKLSNKKTKTLDGSGEMEYSSRMHSLTSLQKHSFNVYIYNAQRLSLFCPTLARKYCIDVSNIEKMCEDNATVIVDTNRKDLSEFWQYCTILANASRPGINEFTNQFKPWPSQLLGRPMCVMWLEHFFKMLDIQSAAMLIVVMLAIDARFDTDFELKYNYSSILGNKMKLSPESIQDNPCTDNASSTSLTSYVNIMYDGLKCYKVFDDKSSAAIIISDGSFDGQGRYHSASYGEPEHQCGVVKRQDKYADMMCSHRESCRLIEPKKMQQYGLIILHYARMLSAQNLLTAATKIMRKVLPATFFTNISMQEQFSVRFIQGSLDMDDSNSKHSFSDLSQRIPSSRHDDPGVKGHQVPCSICRLSVHGLLSLCTQCNHGGHMEHITAWFARPCSQGFCPTGCGCQCSAVSDSLQELVPAVFL